MHKNATTSTVKTPAANFTGDVWMNPVFGADGTRHGHTEVLRAGESVWTPAGEEHFHGGTADKLMCHYAILDSAGEGEATTWLEPVTDKEYAAAHTAA